MDKSMSTWMKYKTRMSNLMIDIRNKWRVTTPNCTIWMKMLTTKTSELIKKTILFLNKGKVQSDRDLGVKTRSHIIRKAQRRGKKYNKRGLLWIQNNNKFQQLQ